MDGEVAELHVDPGDLSQQLKMNAMRLDERKMFAMTKEDELEGVVKAMMTNMALDDLQATLGSNTTAASAELRSAQSSAGVASKVLASPHHVLGRQE